MEYSTYYTQSYPDLTTANLQANNAYTIDSTPQNGVAQIQQNLFYLDPFDSKLDQSIDPDHASFSSIIYSLMSPANAR